MGEGRDVRTVLNVIDTGGPGGAETVFANISSGLDPKYFRSVCVVSREGWLTDRLRSRGLEPIVVSASGSVNFRYLWRLMQIARAVKADVIVGHLYGSAIYCSIAGKLLGVPVVSVLHGQTDVSDDGHFGALKKRAVRLGTTKAVFVSQELKDDLRTRLRIPEEQCAVIPNGVEIERFAGGKRNRLREELGLSSSDILVGAIGNIRRPKAYDVFLHAAHLLKQRSENYRFAIAGEGSGSLYDELLTLRDKLKLQNELNFLGMRRDIPDILKAFDVYVLSSRTEGFSIACVEAMAAGVPVVATRSGGPQEILEHERSGLLVEVGDSAGLADSVHRLVSDPALASQLRDNALATVTKRYTLRAMLQTYEELFQSLPV